MAVQTELQYPVTAVFEHTYAAAVSHTISLPAGSLVTAVVPVISTAYNAGTTNTITITDGTTAFAAAVTIGATGPVAVTTPTRYYPTGATITITTAMTGTAATAGKGAVALSYVVVGRQHENRG